MPQELQCLSEPNASLAVFDYVCVPNMKATMPMDWIIAYEKPTNHGGEGACILYVDGRVELLGEPTFSTELERVRKEMEAAELGEER